MKRYAEYQKINPFRTPTWRFDRVLRLLEGHQTPRRCTPRDDADVRAMRRFVLRWNNRNEEEREKLLWENPGLYCAYELYANFLDDPMPALMVQARLLARQSHLEVGKNLGLLPDTVRWYESMFFNVLDRIDQRDWIVSRVLMPSVLRSVGGYRRGGAPEDDNPMVLPLSPGEVRPIAMPFFDASIKIFAYFGGPLLVDHVLHGFKSGHQLASREDADGWYDAQWNSTLRRRSAQAAMQFQINRYNVMELFNIHTRIMELEQSDESQEHKRTSLEKHIRTMLDDLPLLSGDMARRHVKATPLAKFDDSAAELRDDELLRAASGAPMEDAEILSMTMPPTRPTALLRPPTDTDTSGEEGS